MMFGRKKVTGRLGSPAANLPNVVIGIRYGPDDYSGQMAVANTTFANPASPSNIGIGVRPAVSGGSNMAGTKTDAWYSPVQNFRGVPGPIVDPSLRTLKPTGSLPSGNQNIDPTLLAWTPPLWNGVGSWVGDNGGVTGVST
jgi:hypothetical protein